MMENMNMRSEDCQSFLESLSAYLDGELSAAEKEKIEYHMENCDGCRAMYEKFLTISADIKSIETVIPDDLHLSIMNAVREADVKSGGMSLGLHKKLRRWGLWIGAGAVAVFCIAMLGSPIFRGGFDMKLAREADDAEICKAEYNGAAAGNYYAAYDASKEMAAEDFGVDIYEMEIESSVSYSITNGIGDDKKALSIDDGNEDPEMSAQGDVSTCVEQMEDSKDLLDGLCYIKDTDEKMLFPLFFPERGVLDPIK